MKKDIPDPYMKRIVNEVNSISSGIFDNIKNLDQYSQSVSQLVLKILMQCACLGQNYGPIEIGRKKIGEIINRDWLIHNFMKVADESINYSDEWEYRRLVELVVLHIPELKEEVLAKGINSENEEVREVVDDYRDKYHLNEDLLTKVNLLTK